MSTTTILREYEAELVVRAAEVVAADVVSLTLTAPDDAALPPWTPGAHIDLVLDENLVRQYSLCGNPIDGHRWRVSILRAADGRGGSRFVHDHLQAGARVRVRGPRNHFPLVNSPAYVFIAGGIGITPLLPMIAEAHAAGADWTLLYGGRSRSSMAHLDELAAYGDRVTVAPSDEAGRPDLAGVLGTPRTDTLVYCCGPEGLMAAVEEHCAAWPAGALHVERFAPKAIDPAVAAEDEAFELVLARSGLTLQVPTGRSVFDVVKDAGVSVLGSCFEGTCGTCETEVVDGDVDHRDSVLNDDEKAANEFMMICVSRCRSARLTLDL